MNRAQHLLHSLLGPTVTRFVRPSIEFIRVDGETRSTNRTKTTLFRSRNGARETARRRRQIAAGQIKVG